MSHGFIVPKVEYSAPSDGYDQYAESDLSLTKAVAATLETHYPGHPWRVEVSHKQGIVKIQIPIFMGPTHWYVLHITTLKEYERGKRAVMRAGGDILERYQIPRARFGLDDFLNARSLIPAHRAFHGHVPQ